MQRRLSDTITAACDALPPRKRYARAVLCGRYRWSGSDIKGKAARFGSSYARQRDAARSALFRAGGLIVADRRTGFLRAAVEVCVDDFGNQVYEVSGRGIVLCSDLRAELRRQATLQRLRAQIAQARGEETPR